MSKSNSKAFEDGDPNEDDEWLFDSIVAYLSSPIWSIPIQHFIESNCSIFSSNDSWSGGALLDDDEDENLENVSTELLDVHLKYKDLVDTLINTFLQDIGVSYNKFVRACKKSSRFTDHPVYLELFEQVWCAENFRLFKAQMVRKNIELELQALVLLQYQLGIIKSGRGEIKNETDDDEIMAIVIRKSKDEYDNLVSSKQRNLNPDLPIQKPQDLETAKKLVKSEELVENLKTELNQQEYINRKILEEGLANKIERPTDRPMSSRDRPMSSRDRPMSARRSGLENDLKNMRLDENTSNFKDNRKKPQIRDDDDDEDIVSSNKPNSKPVVNDLTQTVLAQSGLNLTQSEIERRAELMRKQREILNERKKIERQKQLEQFMHESSKSGEPIRPMSSRAARSVLSGADPTQMQQPTSNSKSEEEKRKLEARKALAETLRKEVVNNSKKN